MFKFANDLPSVTYAELEAEMGLNQQTLMGAPGTAWASQAFITRGIEWTGKTLPDAYIVDLDVSVRAEAQAHLWTTVAAWVTAYPVTGNTCTNAYIKVSKVQIHILSKKTGLWTRIDELYGALSGGLGQWSLDFSTSYGTAPTIRDTDCQKCHATYRSGAHIMLHNSITSPIFVPDPFDVGGVFVTCESQLVPAIGVAFNATPNYVMSLGIDLYPDRSTDIGSGMLLGVTYIPAIGGARFKTIPTDGTPTRHYFVTLETPDTFIMNASPYDTLYGNSGLTTNSVLLAANLPSVTANTNIPLVLSNFGPQTFVPTPLAQGTMYVSPTGSAASPGTDVNSPTSIQEAFDNAVAGDVVFLREGNYYVDGANLNMWAEGSAENPVIFERYPGDGDVVINGSLQPRTVGPTLYKCNISGKFQIFRDIKWKNFPEYGAYVSGSYNLFENCEASYNGLSGFFTYASGSYPWASANYNGFISCWAHHNSDVSLTGGNWANGGNADGFALSRGIGNYTRNCLSEYNSDDGFDFWVSRDSRSDYDVSRYNGAGDGNGNGGKYGGNTEGQGCIVTHLLVYGNLANGADSNTGIGVIYDAITAWDNGEVGIVLESDTVVTRCVSLANGTQVSGTGVASRNSWNMTGSPTITLVSTNEADQIFLQVVQNGQADGIGAHYK